MECAGLVKSQSRPLPLQITRKRDYNRGVTRLRFLWAVALVAFLLSAVAPQATGSWQCEGRTCGVTPWYCCCDSPAGAQDGNCRSSARSASSTAACARDCGCELTVHAGHVLRRTPPMGFPSPIFHPVLNPGAAIIVAPVPSRVLARSLETRGPPLPCRAWNTPSLRAPPVA
jgi:hypothetical protein